MQWCKWTPCAQLMVDGRVVKPSPVCNTIFIIIKQLLLILLLCRKKKKNIIKMYFCNDSSFKNRRNVEKDAPPLCKCIFERSLLTVTLSSCYFQTWNSICRTFQRKTMHILKLRNRTFLKVRLVRTHCISVLVTVQQY